MLVLEAERGSHKASTTGSNEKQVCVDKVPCLGFSLEFKNKLIACELLRKKNWDEETQTVAKGCFGSWRSLSRGSSRSGSECGGVLDKGETDLWVPSSCS